MLQVGNTSITSTITKSKPTVVVGLDFGTTFSGFAYALASDPGRINKFYDWPMLAVAGGKNYCKTPTSLLYKRVSGEGRADSYELEDWGYAAFAKHANNLQSKDSKQREAHQIIPRRRPSNDNNIWQGTSSPYDFITRFKLLLSEQDPEALAPAVNDDVKLPNGLTARKAITDYLRKLSELILSVLQNNLGSHIAVEDIQWCLTVPAIWDERAKQEMKTCAQLAGLIQGEHCFDQEASPHQLIIVLEPEAASLYCQEKAELSLCKGDRFLVVDVGGGTVDLVLHEKVGDLKVREVSPRSGGLCGGTYVDRGFLQFLSQKIECFPKFSMEHPQSVLKLKGWWETIKYDFDGTMHFPYELELPAKLARAWEATEKASLDMTFDVIELSIEDMLRIFDPVVDKIVKLIENQMIEGVKAIMVVGGFSSSPYLMKRIKEGFSDKVEDIIIPSEPGSAICCGAVLYGIRGADAVISRFSRKTYGISLSRPFMSGDPIHLTMPGPGGRLYCNGVFQVYVRNGQDIGLDQCVSRTFSPPFSDQTETEVCLYSTYASDPRYVEDSGVRKEGSFIINHPSRQKLGSIGMPKLRVSLWFGRTFIEVTAVGRNFGNGETFAMAPVTFEKSSDDQ